MLEKYLPSQAICNWENDATFSDPMILLAIIGIPKQPFLFPM